LSANIIFKQIVAKIVSLEFIIIYTLYIQVTHFTVYFNKWLFAFFIVTFFSPIFRLFVEEINKTNFQGVSGHIHFNGGDRPGNISIIQKFLNETRLVGRYEPGKDNSPGSLQIYQRQFRWLTQGGIRPTDGNAGKGNNSLELIKKRFSQ